MTRLTTCPDDETVATRAADHVTRVLDAARRERGVAHLAISGGTTPGRTYELLAAEPERLREVELWFADERCVGPEDAESNYRLAVQSGLVGGAIQSARAHRMLGEAGPQEGASLYAAELVRRLGGDTHASSGGGVAAEGAAASAAPPRLDLVLLGIGPDGHVASLFPGAATLAAGESAVCLGVTDSPKPPPERITLSLAVLRAARGCLLLATGASKVDAVEAMLGEPTPHVPASLLDRDRLTVIVDDAAAPRGPLR
jgi:6-phosphogluconolactonase